MTKRVVGFVSAAVLAVIGVSMLLAYVRSAEDRALAGEEVTEVWVVSDRIPRGTAAEDIESSVRVERVPAKVRVSDGVVELEELDGLVSVIDLQPGEQLMRSRFDSPQTLTGFEGPSLEVPDSFVEVSVAVDPQRGLGGNLSPGELVSVFASFEPFEVAAPELPDGSNPILEVDGTLVSAGDQTPSSTHVILSNALVTNVQLQRSPTQNTLDQDGDEVGLAPAPDNAQLLVVTLALSPPDAERFVFTAEHGSVWFAVEGDAVSGEDTFVRTRGNVYTGDGEGSRVSRLPDEARASVASVGDGG